MWFRRAAVAMAMALGFSVITRPTPALGGPTTAPAGIAPAAETLSFDNVGLVKVPARSVPLSDQPAAESINPPTAPLPSALLAGPATMAVAGWITWRIRKRGGRI